MFHRLVLLALCFSAVRASAGPTTEFLVVAADRGFRGNETVEKRFAEYHERYPGSRLFFTTGRMQRERLETALGAILDRKPDRLVILPLFVSGAEAEWAAFLSDLEALRDPFELDLPVEIAPPFGKSPTAAILLTDVVERARTGRNAIPVVVVGSGAFDETSASEIRSTIEDAGRFVRDDLHVEVLFSGRDEGARRENALVYERIRGRSEGSELAVVPFFLDFRADHHMSVDSALARAIESPRIRLEPTLPDEHPELSSWLARSSAAALPPTPETLGVVLLSHGADLVWNEQIELALTPLAQRYDTEFSFHMADPWLLQEAVRALEARGKTHIVIYRLFGLERSFRSSIESLIGKPSLHTHHHGSAAATPIRSSAQLATFGGIEDHPLFAEVLRERALGLSGGDRTRETVMLVAHGAGSEEDDRHWNEVLASLGLQMQTPLDPPFHAVLGATLREDWPEEHAVALAGIESAVEAHNAAGRRVIAVEARLNGPGPTRRLLEPLGVLVDDEGFVPHPNVSRMVLEDLESYLLKNAPEEKRR